VTLKRWRPLLVESGQDKNCRAAEPQLSSADFQACCVAGFQIGSRSHRSWAPQVWKPALLILLAACEPYVLSQYRREGFDCIILRIWRSSVICGIPRMYGKKAIGRPGLKAACSCDRDAASAAFRFPRTLHSVGQLPYFEWGLLAIAQSACMPKRAHDTATEAERGHSAGLPLRCLSRRSRAGGEGRGEEAGASCY
jgi:hypothetical protein